MAIWAPKAIFDGVFDISDNNGIIDWTKVPITYAMVCIKATQGSTHVDPTFQTNRHGALARGLLVMPYHFLDPVAPVSAQVDLFLKTTAAAVMTPLMIDWEVEPRSNLRAPVSTMQNFGAAIQKATGRAPLAYHGMYDLTSPIINAWPWEVPKYGPQPQGPHYLLWQYTDTAGIPGISGHVDRSRFSGTLDELKAWYATGAMPAGFP